MTKNNMTLEGQIASDEIDEIYEIPINEVVQIPSGDQWRNYFSYIEDIKRIKNLKTIVPPQPPKINCPKHGVHTYTIQSNVAGHDGYFCQLCWLETLNKCELVTDEG